MSHGETGVETGVEFLPSISVQDISSLRNKLNQPVLRGLFCLYGSWNSSPNQAEGILRSWRPAIGPEKKFVIGMVQVDESDESMEVFCGDNDCDASKLDCEPPDELPALLAVIQDESKSSLQIVQDISCADILSGSPHCLSKIKATFNSLILGIAQPVKARPKRKLSPAPPAVRIFVAGDRSQVGKTSVCLGILGSLIEMGYEASSLAYVKPATQDESKQLLQTYCEDVGIKCDAIGPIVYYKGFTRAFLAGETDNTAELLDKVSTLIDELSANKRVVVIDGVGYPAVGSICGTDNATVAKACGYSHQRPLGVVLVGPSGVGNAVDSFNLNASYFLARGIPVLGGIFNKLSLEGYYSLENCRDQLSSYFRQYQSERSAFGFVPLFPELGSENPMDHVKDFIKTFAENVNMKGIIESAKKLQHPSSSIERSCSHKPSKRSKANSPKGGDRLRDGVVPVPIYASRPPAAAPHIEPSSNRLTREQIEAKASYSGAVTSC